MKQKETKQFYLRAGERVRFTTKCLLYSMIEIPFIAFAPFLVAFSDWAFGNYTLDSWMYIFPVW